MAPRTVHVFRTFLHLIVCSCFYSLYTNFSSCFHAAKTPPLPTTIQPPNVSKEILKVPREANVTFVPLNPDTSAVFELSNPQGTKHDDPNPYIIITSATWVQPDQEEWFLPGETDFQNCSNLEPYTRCYYSADPHALNYSSAVLFHSRFLDEIPLPPRTPDQKWIFFESESPSMTWPNVNLDSYRDLFNVTSTFTMDSDLPVTYHKSTCIPSSTHHPPERGYAGNKTKQVVWFVSSCTTYSRREEYVRALMNHISVDIFGECGREMCGKGSGDPETCVRDLVNSNYKFYLSFENSLCREYHTEKLSRTFSLNVIPVVLGLSDYPNILPRGAYIDVRDFPSPRALAEYLHKVDQDDELYDRYVYFKNRMWCHLPSTLSYQCELCEYLHKHRYERQMVHDVAAFWNTRDRCMHARDFYHDIAPEILPFL